MQSNDEQVKRLFAAVSAQPLEVSTVDVVRAIETGKRRKRLRRIRLGAAGASLSVIAAIGIPYALQASSDRGAQAAATASPSAQPSPSPTAKAGFQTREYERPAARPLPVSCNGSKLPVPGGGIKSYVSNLDPSGRYVTGRVYEGGKDPVLWRDGQAVRVPFGGADDSIQAANSHGDAVGFIYKDNGPYAKAYVKGVLSELKGGVAEASGINDAGKIIGYLERGRESVAVVWLSATSEPVELTVPEGTRIAQANDIDEDGTIVGSINNAGSRTAFVWYPDGTAQALPTPMVGGKPATDFDARRVRAGWVTGYLTVPDGGSAGVRWDLVTGKVDVFDQLRWSNDVSPHGWIAGMDSADDAVLTDGVNTLKLPRVFAKPELGMNWAQAISDDGLTIAGINDDENYDGEQRGVLWRCQ